MDKVGRNDPCPCGSGKKYKKCCLPADEEKARKEHAAFIEQQAASSRRGPDDYSDEEEEEDQELTRASNAVIDMVKAGALDDAERAAHDLLARYPYVHDGYDRLGMVYEARGDKARAADYYRQALAFVREHADNYDPQFEEVYVKLIERLEAPANTGPDGG